MQLYSWIQELPWKLSDCLASEGQLEVAIKKWEAVVTHCLQHIDRGTQSGTRNTGIGNYAFWVEIGKAATESFERDRKGDSPVAID